MPLLAAFFLHSWQIINLQKCKISLQFYEISQTSNWNPELTGRMASVIAEEASLKIRIAYNSTGR